MEDINVAIEKASKPQQEFLKKLFKHIPITSNSYQLVKMKADTRFISSNSHCDEIWILLDGRVKAIEEHLSGDVYVFTEFQAPELFGEMEGLSGLSLYK